VDTHSALLPRSLRPTWHLLLYGVVVSAVFGSGALTFTTPAGEGTPPVSRPNIVLIVTDDQRWDIPMTRYMPRMSERFVPGVNAAMFQQAFVTDPVCCPSRVSILTGRYPSSTGVFGNGGHFAGPSGTGGGGFKAFNDDPRVNPTIAVDLHDAGYRTMLIGKYLNHYNPATMSRYVPPGWDRWFATEGGVYYDYTVATGHGLRRFGDAARDYSSRVFADEAVRFVSSSDTAGVPFFLYLAPSAPHLAATPAPQDVGRFEDAVARYRDPLSVGVQNNTDPPIMGRHVHWTPRSHAAIDAFHARQLDSLYSLDRALAPLWASLPADTVVLFTSDNGMLWGEHGLVGKGVAYNEVARVPMMLGTIGMGLPQVRVDRIALNIDIRATLGSYAGLTPSTDGRSWTDPAWRRRWFVIEDWEAHGNQTSCAVRSDRYAYGRFGTGEETLYDETRDPFELTNIAAEPPPHLHRIRERAHDLCTRGAIYPPGWPFR
jgi:N-acetylglucosamine-6-sulfatase